MKTPEAIEMFLVNFSRVLTSRIDALCEAPKQEKYLKADPVTQRFLQR